MQYKGSKQYIFSIDPGTTESGVCLVRTSDFKPLYHAKIDNYEVFSLLKKGFDSGISERIYINNSNTDCVIEMVASYGMPVGAEVFETVVWIGRFIQYFSEIGILATRVYRKDEKLQICNSLKANDASIRQALVDMFAYGQSNYGKGTKKEPGFFYGFSADQWQAFAVAITYLLLRKEI